MSEFYHKHLTRAISPLATPPTVAAFYMAEGGILENLPSHHFSGIEDIIHSATGAKAQPRSVAKMTY